MLKRIRRGKNNDCEIPSLDEHTYLVLHLYKFRGKYLQGCILYRRSLVQSQHRRLENCVKMLNVIGKSISYFFDINIADLRFGN